MTISSLAVRRLSGHAVIVAGRRSGRMGAATASSTMQQFSSSASSSSASSTISTSSSSSLLFPSSNKRFQSVLSSFSEPGTLFESEDFLTAATTSATSSTKEEVEDRDAPLRADVRTMGRLLGHIIQDHHGEEIFDTIETLRGLAKQWRDAGAGRHDSDTDKQIADDLFQQLNDTCSNLSTDELLLVSRAFTHFLAMANAAEGHHRYRLFSSRTGFKFDSCSGVLHELKGGSVTPEEIMNHLSNQQVELVLTAHPTQVNRRTILEKQRRVQEILTKADTIRTGTNPSSPSTIVLQQELDASLEREIASLWQSDEVSRTKPTPEDEAARGTLVVESVLWEALPSFLRKFNVTLQQEIHQSLPLTAAPIIYSSWMGGDRDGNPNVKPETTRWVCLSQRERAAKLLSRDLLKLQQELSITKCSNEFFDVVNSDVTAAREPYRAYLRPMVAKMNKTIAWASEQLADHQDGTIKSANPGEIYLDKKELLDELLFIHKSLCETGNKVTADGFLTDIIRNVSAFGLTLATLDIRQESTRHEEAIDSITRFLGLGSYSQWDEETKITWLQQQLSSPRPLLRPGIWKEKTDFFSDTAVDTLDTFAMMANLHAAGCEDSLGAYVISQATTASDVLAVLLLQRDAGVKRTHRVVPLFETLGDLKGAEATMRQLFSLPGYMGSINGKQEIMIGYSDSAKDAGRLAASWAQYETQEALANVAREFGVEVTFFHGKGGTVGRGGNPQTFKAIMAHPPKTINGRFRVTEQGEMINQNFGYVDRAERTMDIYTAAVLAEKLSERGPPTDEFRAMMNKISDISCEAYRKIVRGDERFVPYFRSATPELELSNLNIGSRPAKRKAGGGVESLRAIPWNFAWTQTRLNLPTWLGVGEALNEMLNNEDADKVRDLYRDCKSFRTTIDLVEMVLSKSEPAIAAHYDHKLVTDPLAQELGAEVRAMHAATEQAVLDLTGHSELSEDNLMLKRLLRVRNPYVDCLNVLQAETLKRIREYEPGDEPKALKDSLMTTITGIANGMGNTG